MLAYTSRLLCPRSQTCSRSIGRLKAIGFRTYMSIYDTRLRGRNFRLLNLLPGDETSPLRCDLFESSLDRPVAYEALSYVWGDISATEPIFCGGRTLSITASLAEALRSLRSKHSRRVLWADGICINQRDLEERSHQVQLMGRVYANAGRVIAWLGPDHDDIGEIVKRPIRLTHDFFRQFLTSKPRSTIHEFLDFDVHTIRDMRLAFTDAGYADPVPALNKLFRNQYWQRVWCAQELIKAATIVIRLGSTELSGRSVAIFVAWYQSHVLMAEGSDIFTGSGIDNAAQMLRKLGAKRPDQHSDSAMLLPTLHGFRNLQATDQRDKVYGIIGIVQSPDDEPPVEVDYNKPVAQVYCDVVEGAMKDNGDLQVLSYVEHPTEYEYHGDVPSWIPLWHVSTKVTRFLWPRNNIACAGRPMQVHPNISFNGECASLTLTGIYLDRVSYVSHSIEAQRPLFSKDEKLKKLITTLAKLVKDPQDNTNAIEASDSTEYEPSAEAIATAFTGGFTSMKSFTQESTYIDELRRDETIRTQYMEGFWRCVRGEQTEALPSQRFSFEDMARLMCHRRRIFRTSRGYIGLGPRCMHVGDIVAVLDGGKVPFVLRPLVDGGHEYALMGECFVYDIMDGEVLQMVGHDGVQDKTFVLR